MNFAKKIQYYFWSTYNRRSWDRLQEENRSVYRGTVLDIGGRDRGKFVKPKKEVDQWIFGDINPDFHPDIVLDITNMSNIQSESIDVVSAIQIFCNLNDFEKALHECYRILKRGGSMVLTDTLLYPLTEDPIDHLRWTKEKWTIELKKVGFSIEKLEVIGLFFTVLCEMVKDFIHSLPPVLKWIGYLSFPFLDFLVLFDKTSWVKNDQRLNKYHQGYFIILRKE